MLKSHVIGKWAIGLILLVTASSSSAYTPINTYPVWNGTQYISSFGVPNTATYGQIVTAPPLETRLNSFSFSIGVSSATITFRAEVYAWNGTMATGPALYESAPVSMGNISAYQQFTFTIPGGVPVTPGQQYVLFATTSRDQAGAPSSAARWGSVPNATYAGGQFVFINNTTDTSLWTSTAWSTIAEDLAFTATFTGAPAPEVQVPTMNQWGLIILIALLGIGSVFYLRRRRAEA